MIAEGSGELQLVGLARLDASGHLLRALLVRSNLRLAHLPCCALWWTRERFNTKDRLIAFEDKLMTRIYCLFQWLTGLGCQDESLATKPMGKLIPDLAQPAQTQRRAWAENCMRELQAMIDQTRAIYEARSEKQRPTQLSEASIG